jgi:hypothetical protein
MPARASGCESELVANWDHGTNQGVDGPPRRPDFGLAHAVKSESLAMSERVAFRSVFSVTSPSSHLHLVCDPIRRMDEMRTLVMCLYSRSDHYANFR